VVVLDCVVVNDSGGGVPAPRRCGAREPEGGGVNVGAFIWGAQALHVSVSIDHALSQKVPQALPLIWKT
jgi:hypothetical protein